MSSHVPPKSDDSLGCNVRESIEDHREVIGKIGKALRVCILAHSCRTAGGLIIGRNLIQSLAKVAPEHTYMIVLPPGAGYEDICSAFPQCIALIYPSEKGLILRWFYETFSMVRAVRSFKPDIVLSLSSRALISPPSPQVVHLDDAHFFYPLKHFGAETLKNKWNKLFQKWHLSKQLKKTQLILCQTEVSERRIRETFDYRGRTYICGSYLPPAILEDRLTKAVPEPLRNSHDRWKLLCMSRYYAHKNLEVLADLFSRYREELEDITLFLTIAPDQHPGAKKLLKIIDRNHLGDRIVNVGPVSSREVGEYYRNCQAFIMPTLMESFGIPYLEAMYFQVPILTSDLDFAHAACGDAALYFDPWDSASVKEKILQLKGNPAMGKELSAKGAARLKRNFRPWDEMAKDISEQLREIAG